MGHEGTFRWISTDDIVLYVGGFAENQPDDNGEPYGQDCLILDANFNFMWNDFDCQQFKTPLCEIDEITKDAIDGE